MLLYIIIESIQAKGKETWTSKSFLVMFFLLKKCMYPIENADEDEEGNSLRIPAV